MSMVLPRKKLECIDFANWSTVGWPDSNIIVQHYVDTADRTLRRPCKRVRDWLARPCKSARGTSPDFIDFVANTVRDALYCQSEILIGMRDPFKR